MIPSGFVREQFDVSGSLHNGIRHTASNQIFMFMETVGHDPIWAIFNQDNQGSGVFDAAHFIDQGGDRFIIILGGRDVPTPANFYPTTYTFGGTDFNVWQSDEMPEFHLVYALSSAGHMGLYQFDALDESFQRFMAPIVPEDEDAQEEDQEPTGILGRITEIIRDNIIVALIAVLVIIFLFLIIIIVLSVKVQRRNNELDELYADGQGYYGDDDYDDDGYDDDFEDDDYEYEDDRYHDGGYDNEVKYSDDDYGGEIGYDDDDYEDDDYEYDGYDDDDDDDDDDKRKDDFNIDFVDL
jgi:hypothetical protein